MVPVLGQSTAQADVSIFDLQSASLFALKHSCNIKQLFPKHDRESLYTSKRATLSADVMGKLGRGGMEGVGQVSDFFFYIALCVRLLYTGSDVSRLTDSFTHFYYSYALVA
jgi:hypothetical protein